MKLSEEIQELEQELAKQNNTGERLKLGIEFMESSLFKKETPQFKNFWDARKRCSEYFKENLIPTLRSELWGKFCELTQEARRLKTVLEEQGSFAEEQIELAIQDLEKQIETHHQLVSKSPKIQGLGKRFEERQRDIALYDANASRLHSLRDEVAHLTIRYQKKNILFDRLSKAGDHVFPKRKELMKELSEELLQEIENFVLANFTKRNPKTSFNGLRGQIKEFQHTCKLLSLTAKAHVTIRGKLNRCWDQLNEWSEAYHKEQDQKSEQFQENARALHEKIQSAVKKLEEKGAKPQEVEGLLEEIDKEMRTTELGGKEVKELKNALSSARKPLDDLHEEKIKELQAKKSEKIVAFRKKIADATFDQNQLLSEIPSLPTTPKEKETLVEEVEKRQETLSIQREEALLADLSDDDQLLADQLFEVLTLRKARFQQLQSRVDILRKIAGSSGLDFAESMRVTEEISLIKPELDELRGLIDELESQFE